jgi:hypothetical protein
MAKESLDILKEGLIFEIVKADGEIYEIDLQEALDISRVGSSINSIGTVIAYFEVYSAELKKEVSDQKAELDHWIATQDEVVRDGKGFSRGENKILQAIRRKPGFLDRRYRINEAQARSDKIEGALKALYITSDMLRTKDSTYRKHDELAESVDEYREGTRFNIKKKRRDEKIREKIKKTKEEKNSSEEEEEEVEEEEVEEEEEKEETLSKKERRLLKEEKKKNKKEKYLSPKEGEYDLSKKERKLLRKMKQKDEDYIED